MAEMNVPERASQGKRRAQKRTTRVDLTAMVDLGFLLITFFMLASVFQKPKAMEVNKPVPLDSEELRCFVGKSKTFTLLAGKNDKIYCYTGADDALDTKIDTLTFSRQDLRRCIVQRQQEVGTKWGSPDELFVSIKLFPKSKFRNMVDLLDEMAICGVKRYAIVDELYQTDELVAMLTGNKLE